MSSSEEKDLPPSAKRLQDGRKKGQIAQYRDFATAFVFAGALLFLVAQVQAIQGLFQYGLDTAFEAMTQPADAAAPELIVALAGRAIALIGPLFALVFALTVLVSLVLSKGLVFSLEPLAPKLSKLDPIQGLGRMFGMRALIELGKSLAKVAALGAILAGLLLTHAGSLVYLPACGLYCMDGALRGLALLVLVSTALVFLVVGIIDIPLQTWLFLKDMRMSKSEAKQERKESDGSPEIKSEQHRIRREIANAPTVKLGIEQATILIFGPTAAIGLRFVAEETPVPMVTVRAAAAKVSATVQSARAAGVPTYADEELATSLMKNAAPGRPVQSKDFAAVAKAIYWTSGS